MKKTTARSFGECEHCGSSWEKGDTYYGEPYHAWCLDCGEKKKTGVLRYDRKEKRYKDTDTIGNCDYYSECGNPARFTDKLTGKVLCEFCVGKVITFQEV